VHVRVYVAADDPVRMFNYQTQSPNSVIKFLSDLYSCQRTANLLYTNDAKVLIDIIVRQLNDLSPGDQVLCSVTSLTCSGNTGICQVLCCVTSHTSHSNTGIRHGLWHGGSVSSVEPKNLWAWVSTCIWNPTNFIRINHVFDLS